MTIKKTIISALIAVALGGCELTPLTDPNSELSKRIADNVSPWMRSQDETQQCSRYVKSLIIPDFQNAIDSCTNARTKTPATEAHIIDAKNFVLELPKQPNPQIQIDDMHEKAKDYAWDATANEQLFGVVDQRAQNLSRVVELLHAMKIQYHLLEK